MMNALNVDGLVSSYSPNVFYLTGYYGSQMVHEAQGTGVVVIPKEEPERAILIVVDVHLSAFATRPTWIEDVRAFAGTDDVSAPIQSDGVERYIPEPLRTTQMGAHILRAGYAETMDAALLQALKDLKLDKSRIAFDNLLTVEGLAGSDVEPVSAYRAMAWVRQVKTPEEIRFLGSASRLNQTAIEETVARWRPGMTWRELNRTYAQVAGDFGGVVETPQANVLFNSDAGDPLAEKPLAHPWHTGLEGDYVIRSGSNIMFDCHGWLNKYCWDGGKTWIVDDELKGDGRRIADACGEVTQELVAAMKPGIWISQLQTLGRAVLRKHGLPSDSSLIYFHGLGLDHADLGSLPEPERENQGRFDWVLEKGMISACHIAYPGELRERYFIEDIAVVTDDGGSSFFDWGVKPLVNLH
jgi:Xaa-Pro aminopeptidase